MLSEKDLLFPVKNVTNITFAKNKFINLFVDKNYIQSGQPDQTSSGTVSGNLFFSHKFYTPYQFSLSSLYNGIAYSIRHISENNYDVISNQKYPGIWKTLSSTSSPQDQQQIANKIQYLGLSNYYYNDEIINGGYRIYYYPLVDSGTSSLSALQTQKVLKFFDINLDYFGPNFYIDGLNGNSLKNNLSGSTTALSVELFLRPVGQQKEGYFFHRWTTNSLSSVIDTFDDSSATSTIDFPYYSAYPYYGVGCYFNYLLPFPDSDKESPYIDFYVFGSNPSSTSHYYNLSAGTVNGQTLTRFSLDQKTLNTLFDGSFHALRFIWDITDTNKQGRIFIDNQELLNSTVSGDGRSTALNYSLSTNKVTPFNILSKSDNADLLLSSASASKFSVFGEMKHILVFDKAITGTIITQSITSNNQLFSAIGSSTSNLGSWFGFNSVTSPLSATDLTQSFSTRTTSTSAYITNDNSVSILNPEGKIGKIYSLLFDKVDNTAPTDIFNPSLTSSTILQNPVGRLFNSEYGSSASEHIGYIFYNNGASYIFNDNYNKDYLKSSQLFVSSGGNSFVTNSTLSSSNWFVEYISVMGRSYTNRLLLSITADANYFCKSTNTTSVFKGTDQQFYTKMNTKTINGIYWFDKNGYCIAQTKFSQPIIKKEHNSIVIQTPIDL